MNSIVLLMTIHFFCDFVIQTDWMALNKSKSFSALSAHVAVYGSGFVIFGWKFWAANMAMHFLTDAITSRISSRLWPMSSKHWFFVCIGADQLIHLYCLAYLWSVFGN